MSVAVARAEPSVAGVGDYIELMKPRVMSLVVFTALVGLVVNRMAGGLFTPLWSHFPAGA
jgi:heme O synthase-like polyprenyltransferase